MSEQDQAGRVIVTFDGMDVNLNQQDLGVSMDSPEQDILNAVRGVVSENLVDEDGSYSYTVRKAVNSGTIYVYPKPVAG